MPRLDEHAIGQAAARDRRREQWHLEKQLRERILLSPRSRRTSVTAEAYAELFDRFPDHAVFQADEQQRRQAASLAAGMIRPLVTAGDRVLEVGCGRGDVLAVLAACGATCTGIEPSRHMVEAAVRHPDLTVAYGTADRLEFATGTFDLVFSQQVLEHLHPDDVPTHLREAWRVLRPGGLLAIETPNRRTGPQDVSRGFTDVAEGLHLQEWSVGQLIREYRAAGFVRVRGLLLPPFIARRSTILYSLSYVPASVKRVEDAWLGLVPRLELRTLMGKLLGLDDIFLIAEKPGRRRGGDRRRKGLA